jgi:hypothetical protein
MELVQLSVFGCDDAVGVYHNVVVAEVMKGVDDVFEFVVKESWLSVVNNGQ